MSETGSNRRWGAPASEHVDPDANPDFKQVFDRDVASEADNPLVANPFYAPNCWPAEPESFEAVVGGYYTAACDVGMQVLRGVAQPIGVERDVFDGCFDAPMALLQAISIRCGPKQQEHRISASHHISTMAV
jgi:isopenicillin N synthase-like dioxygenase